jgi:prepilin-type N-terminal cleavage/methylation domain-containing protein
MLYNLQHNLNLLENSMQLKKQTGFTLVEIAIVLVIVGLLIGGVLKGQEMITNAKLKLIESDNAGIAAAMFSYQDRYLQLPGDDGNAGARFDFYILGTGALGDAANGNGDGLIGNGKDWAPAVGEVSTMVKTSPEPAKFFGHLRAAGLIPGGSGTDTTRPSNAYGGQIGIQNGALKMAGHSTVFGQIEGGIARILEARLDDGAPDTGRMQANVAAANAVDALGAAVHPLATKDYLESSRYDIAFRL